MNIMACPKRIKHLKYGILSILNRNIHVFLFSRDVFFFVVGFFFSVVGCGTLHFYSGFSVNALARVEILV